jgi:hypothetical protein
LALVAAVLWITKSSLAAALGQSPLVHLRFTSKRLVPALVEQAAAGKRQE